MHRWAFLIPFRYREEHLRAFVKHYGNLFPDVPIYVIEQNPKEDPETPDKLQGFMRGRLLNVGFLEFGQHFDYFCQSDVDMMLEPEKGEGIEGYRFPENPVHLATGCSQFRYRMPYPNYTGGITLFTPEQYRKFGGFSNHISGFGNEDDQLYNDITKAGFTIERRSCFYKCFDHGRVIVPHLFKTGREIVKNGRSENDTLETTQYDIVSLSQHEGYMKLTVDLRYE